MNNDDQLMSLLTTVSKLEETMRIQGESIKWQAKQINSVLRGQSRIVLALVVIVCAIMFSDTFAGLKNNISRPPKLHALG